MEISCQQCGTVFAVELDAGSGGGKEVVCPGCFQFHVVPSEAGRTGSNAGVPDSELKGSPLGDGGVVDRLRDGFTLVFEVRHPTWPSAQKLNPYQIKQRIYEGSFDGQEEYREKAGRWFPISEHPEFALTFQLVGQIPSTHDEQGEDDSEKKFKGWKGAKKQMPQSLPPAPQVEPILEKPGVKKKWIVVAVGGGVLAIVAGAILSIL